MDKKQDSKKLLAESIMELGLSKSIDDISVQEIVNNCGLSRQTFYNHFPDKYALVEWIYKSNVLDILKIFQNGGSMFDTILAKLNFIYRNPNFYKKVYRKELFLASFTDITKQLYLNMVSHKTNNQLTDQLEFMIDFLVEACVKRTSAWVLGGMKESPEHIATSFLSCIPNGLTSYLLTDDDYARIKNSTSSTT